MISRRKWLVVTVIWIASRPWIGVASADDVQVNTFTTGDQSRPATAMDAGGNFVVVWQSDGSDGTDASGTSIQGQRYDPQGSPVAGEFQINTYTTLDQSRPAVAMGADGDFIVVWQSRILGLDIRGQRYAADGTGLGGEFQANTYTAESAQYGPAVAMGTDGDFVIVWTSIGSAGTDTSGRSIQGRRFAADGSPVAGEFQVNTYTTDSQVFPSVAIAEDGEFVVVWQSTNSLYPGYYISYSAQGQRYAADGTAEGTEFTVFSDVEVPIYPAVAMDAAGKFVVVWRDYSSGYYNILGRRFATNGTPVGDLFQVDAYTSAYPNRPAVAMDAAGDFVVVWQSWNMDDEVPLENKIFGQRYTSDGTAEGDPWQVNTYSTDNQAEPAVAVADGEFVVVWRSDGSGGTDQDGTSVQRSPVELVVVPLIFADGFESGDTSAWSSGLF